MAPSRALTTRLLRPALRTTQRPIRPTTHLLSKRNLTTQPITPQLQTFSSAPHRTTPRPNIFFPARYTTRSYSQAPPSAPEAPDYLNEAELHIFNKIKGELEPVRLEVQDVSGGCGSMYAIEIESPKFKGLTVIKQHKLVNQVLKEEIAKWHGVQLRTKAA